MSLPAMLDDLPTDCDVGMKKDSKGYKSTWVGYKLHIDVADGQIPISCLLTSASLHDSQAAIPLATLSAERTTSSRQGTGRATANRSPAPAVAEGENQDPARDVDDSAGQLA